MSVGDFLRIYSGQAEIILSLKENVPAIIHWGAKLASADDRMLEQITHSGVAHNDSDIVGPFGIWRENARGHTGKPALQSHRSGRDFSPKFEVASCKQDASSIEIIGRDKQASLSIKTKIEAIGHGLFRYTNSVTNEAEGKVFVNDLDSWLPLPDRAKESMDFTGRWARERQPQRRRIQFGTWLREGREGRPGFDHSVIQIAMTENADFQNGEIWSLGLEFSGNPRYGIEKQPTGRSSMMAGPVLLPGEVQLDKGEVFEAPSVIASYSAQGLDGISSNHHEWMRSRENHPTKIRPRPLTLNVWEAVYFDHSRVRLDELAEIASEIGVERLVLDDGWFGSRRDDTKGLGDWQVSSEAWPEGLNPFIEKVHALGMEFGLWFEGEMVNPDSDLYRAHPDWILRVGDRVPPEGRNQQVLDFTNPEAFEYILESVSAVLSESKIDYIKWDHNRILVDPAHKGLPSVLTQTAAIYRMFDTLKERFPGLEIESCSSGGGRIDLGMVQHADRFWTSDCTEAMERQQIQRYSQMAIPPELLGTHISSETSHQTARKLSLNIRGITALFGHAGIEWDISQASSEERQVLATWVDYYKRNRDLLHSGRLVRFEQTEPGLFISGVISHDKQLGILAYVAEQTLEGSNAPRFVIPGLESEKIYSIRAAYPSGKPLHSKMLPDWMDGAQVSGSVLSEVGLLAPVLAPEYGFIIELKAI